MADEKLMDPMEREYDLTDIEFWRSYREEIQGTMAEFGCSEKLPDSDAFWDWLVCLRALHLQEMPYRRYLQSPEWKQTRAAVIERDGGQCRLCNASHRLQVHHRTYERRGVERLNDLTLLCAECHSSFHGES